MSDTDHDTTPAAAPTGGTDAIDTAALLDAGLAPTRPGGDAGRWTPPAVSELVGALPNIEFLELIGAGGMGAVYRARQTHLDRVIALKLLAPARAAAPGFAERFAREARAMARLDHPHIVRLHDFGRAGDWHWLAMEHVEGATLRQVLATGKLSPTEALRLIPQLCDALAHAHAAGVVHRDLKPENILVDQQGRARIADFGLAKLAEPAQAGDSLTATGDVLGTAHYMAPEQLAGSPRVDHRADLYALGVIAYEMLTGALPIGRFDPPSRASGVAPAVDEAVFKSLERDPERRHRDAGELRDAFARSAPPRAEAEQPRPAQAPDGQSVDVGPIHVSPGRVRVGDTIEVGPEGVRVGGIRVDQHGPRLERKDHERAVTGGSRQLHSAGMTALLGGSMLGLWLAAGNLQGLLMDPHAHLAAHRAEDLALLATPLVLVGGAALLTRTLLVAAVLGTIAALLYAPWALAQHWTLLVPTVIALIWFVTTLHDFPRLRDHFASLPTGSRLPRLLLLVPLLAAAILGPAVIFIA